MKQFHWNQISKRSNAKTRPFKISSHEYFSHEYSQNICVYKVNSLLCRLICKLQLLYRCSAKYQVVDIQVVNIFFRLCKYVYCPELRTENVFQTVIKMIFLTCRIFRHIYRPRHKACSFYFRLYDIPLEQSTYFLLPAPP